MSRIQYPKSTDIVCLEADINYTIFHLVNGKRLVSSSTLKRHEEAKDHRHFMRINRHLLINPIYIQHIISEGSTKRVILKNGHDCVVSRRRVGVLDGVVG